MKRFFVSIVMLFFAFNPAFTQNAQSPVGQMDDAVRSLAGDIHAKLVELRAEKIIIGQFTFQNEIPQFSTYWTNQLIAEITNIRGRNYSVHSSGAQDAQFSVSGEIVQVADIFRVYSTLVRLSNRSIEASFYSSFQRDQIINDMVSFSEASRGGSAGGARDAREPDSWESPVIFSIGSNPNTAVINRTITEGDEDFFLLVPERDGRLTAETTGNTDTFMHFFNYDTGEEIASNDDGGQGTNSRITLNVRAGTRYLAVIRGFSASTNGPYGFRAFLIVREGASSFHNPISYEIGLGEANAVLVNRTLQEGDEDYFLLVPDRDGRLTIETTGRIDTYIELFDAGTGEILDENDDGGNNLNARLRYNVHAGGRYIVMVRGYSSSITGSYSFRSFFPGSEALPPDEYEPDNEPSQAKLIETGETQNRTFHSGNDVDWVRFHIVHAGRFVINARGVNSNRLDTYIELYDENLNLIAEDDDSGDSLSSRLTLNLNSGIYFLKVWCLDEEPEQGYILSITQ